jgi:nucleotide-binding universal stress UspA family protein
MSSAEQRVQKILVPIDGSNNAFSAASFAISLAKMCGSELMIIHVSQINHNLELLGIYGAPYPDTTAEFVKTAKAQSQPWFERISKEAKEAGVNVSRQQVVDGPMSVVGEIVNYAETNGADMIVIGSRGRTGFTKLLLGSVASGVVTYAPCPVLVIK